ncbi:alpha/beta hydrolase [Sphingomonas sp.]|uniref:alpha/beta hydrolase n=1 Tax=Sphingomonas sp. TaxID=28214 RepID=UPI003AFFDB5D
MIRRIGLAILVIVAALGIVAWNTEPPRLLSWADAAVGGGRGAELVGDAIPFGTTGQTLDVWRPSATSATARLPVLIFWYGGGWVHGDRRAYAFAARAFARAGFVVVVPDYRKVPGVRFPAFVQDGAQAVRWTRDNVGRYGGDPGRIGVSGHSAGAYVAAMLTLDRRWLRAEGVDPRVIKAAAPMCGPYDFFPFDKRRSIDAFSGAKDGPMTQPIHFARADAPPMLLLTAGNDVQVGAHNANNLTARLTALGAPVEHRDYPGLSHENVAMALSVPFRGKAPVLANTVAFLRRTLR